MLFNRVSMVSYLFSPNPMRLEEVEWDHPADIDPICGQLGMQPASHAEQVHPVVGGMFSILRFPEANILFLASSTLLREDVR